MALGLFCPEASVTTVTFPPLEEPPEDPPEDPPEELPPDDEPLPASVAFDELEPHANRATDNPALIKVRMRAPGCFRNTIVAAFLASAVEVAVARSFGGRDQEMSRPIC
jgi:hypothetical protein